MKDFFKRIKEFYFPSKKEGDDEKAFYRLTPQYLLYLSLCKYGILDENKDEFDNKIFEPLVKDFMDSMIFHKYISI